MEPEVKIGNFQGKIAKKRQILITIIALIIATCARCELQTFENKEPQVVLKNIFESLYSFDNESGSSQVKVHQERIQEQSISAKNKKRNLNYCTDPGSGVSNALSKQNEYFTVGTDTPSKTGTIQQMFFLGSADGGCYTQCSISYKTFKDGLRQPLSPDFFQPNSFNPTTFQFCVTGCDASHYGLYRIFQRMELNGYVGYSEFYILVRPPASGQTILGHTYYNQPTIYNTAPFYSTTLKTTYIIHNDGSQSKTYTLPDFQDDDGDNVAISLSSDCADLATLAPCATSYCLTIGPTMTTSGSYACFLTLSDGWGGELTDTLSINVIATNNVPVITTTQAQLSFTYTQNTWGPLQFAATDANEDPITFTAFKVTGGSEVPLPAFISFSSSGLMQMSAIPPNNGSDQGMHDLHIYANDGYVDSNMLPYYIYVNCPPYVTQVADQNVRVSDIANIAIFGYDIGPLTYTVFLNETDNLPIFMTFYPSTNVLSVQPTILSQVGIYNIKVQVTDNYPASTDMYFKVTVYTNTKPTFASALPARVDIYEGVPAPSTDLPACVDPDPGQQGTATLTLAEAMGMAVPIFITQSGSCALGLRIDYDSALADFTTGTNIHLRLTLTDASGGSNTYDMYVYTNRAPYFTAGGALSASYNCIVGQSNQYNIPNLIDAENNAISITLEMQNFNLVPMFLSIVIGTPKKISCGTNDASNVGPYALNLLVSDSAGSLKRYPFTIQVKLNTPPQLSFLIPDITVCPGQTNSIFTSFTPFDIDGQQLFTINLVNQATNLAQVGVTVSGYTIIINQGLYDKKSRTITMQFDLTDQIDSTQVTFNIITNVPPIALDESRPVYKYVPNLPAVMPISDLFRDPDTTDVVSIYSIVPQFVDISMTTPTFTLTQILYDFADADLNLSNMYAVTVRDSMCLNEAVVYFYVLVVPNTIPYNINGESDFSVAMGDTYTTSRILFSDLEQTTLTIDYTLYQLAFGDVGSDVTAASQISGFLTVINSLNGVAFQINPQLAQMNQDYYFIVTGNDGELYSDELRINMRIYNTMPQFSESPFPSLDVYRGHSSIYRVYYSDEDPNQSVSLTASFCDGTVISGSLIRVMADIVTVTASISEPMTQYCLKFVLNDDYERNEQEMYINVLSNNPPFFQTGFPDVVYGRLGQELTYEFPHYVDAEGDNIVMHQVGPLPNFLTRLRSHFIIKPTDSTDLGEHIVYFYLTDSFGQSSSPIPCKILILEPLPPAFFNMGPPYFQDLYEFPELILTLGEDQKLVLPSIIEPDNETYRIQLKNFTESGIYQFLEYSNDEMIFTSILPEHIGEYYISILLSDARGKQSSYPMKITVLNNNKSEEFKNQTMTNQTIEDIFNTQNDAPLDSQIDENTTLPDITITDKSKLSRNLRAEINKITNQGRLDIVFNTDVMIPRYYDKFDQKILELSIITPSSNSYKNTKRNLQSIDSRAETTQIIDFQWQIKQYGSRKFSIDVDFSQPLGVSREAEHTLQVKFVQNGYFVEKESKKAIEQNFVIRKRVPRQMLKDRISKLLGDNADAIQTSVSASINANIFSNLFLSQTLQFLWGLINSLQLIVRLPLLNLAFPANVQMVLGLIIDVTNFSFFSTRPYEEQLLGMTYTDAYNINFESMGYDTVNIIYNLGLMFWYLPIILIIMLFVRIFGYVLIKSKLGSKISENLEKRVFFSILLRYTVESYLEVLMCSTLNLKNIILQSSGDYFAFLASLLLFAITLLTPYTLYFLFKKHSHKLHQQQSITKFGSLYADLRYEKMDAIAYTSLFMVRRQIFVFSAVFLNDSPMIQVNLQFLQSLIMIGYLARVRPFSNISLNRLEIFNELCILAITYPVLLFTGSMDADPELQYQIGWVMLLLILFNVLVNFLIVFYQAYKVAIERSKELKNYLQQKYQQKVRKQAYDDVEEKKVKISIKEDMVSIIIESENEPQLVNKSYMLSQTHSELQTQSKSNMESNFQQVLKSNKVEEPVSKYNQYLNWQNAAQKTLKVKTNRLKRESTKKEILPLGFNNDNNNYKGESKDVEPVMKVVSTEDSDEVQEVRRISVLFNNQLYKKRRHI